MPMKKVMVFGTFDGVHAGHLNLFTQARAYGDYLIVVIARDVNVKKIKNAYPNSSEKKRQKEIHKVKEVDRAVLGYLRNKLAIIKEQKPDIVCLGYDQKIEIPELKQKLEVMGMRPEIYRLESYKPEEFKSSIINNQNGK